MSWTDFIKTDLGAGVIALRLMLAIVLGAVIGLEREWRERSAGLRTHILVSLAASAFAVIALEIIAASSDPESRTDPIRVVEAVTAGVAFLAAGSIIRVRSGIHGLTTGAGLWLAGAIGVACGMGILFVAVLTTLLGFVVISLLRSIEYRLPKKGD